MEYSNLIAAVFIHVCVCVCVCVRLGSQYVALARAGSTKYSSTLSSDPQAVLSYVAGGGELPPLTGSGPQRHPTVSRLPRRRGNPQTRWIRCHQEVKRVHMQDFASLPMNCLLP